MISGCVIDEIKEKKRGDERIRTADGGFADPCLAAWLRRRVSVR